VSRSVAALKWGHEIDGGRLRRSAEATVPRGEPPPHPARLVSGLPTGDSRTAEEEPVRLPIEDALDLHSFAPRDIPSVVEEYLQEAWRAGFSEIRLIHGRGTGTQRAIVQALLARHPLVRAFADAPPERGGWGATIVSLRH